MLLETLLEVDRRELPARDSGRHVPPALRTKTRRAHDELVSGLQLTDVAQQSAARGQVAERDELRKCVSIDPAFDSVCLQDRLCLRREHELTGIRKIVERLDAKPVAGEKQFAAAGVENCKGEHPDEALEARRAPTTIREEKHLRVALRAEGISLRLQVAAELAEVVDFAVVHHDIASRSVAHGLVPGRRKVDDRQSVMGEPDRTLGPKALVVGTAVPRRDPHALERARIDGSAVEAEDACYAAHEGTICRQGSIIVLTPRTISEASLIAEQAQARRAHCTADRGEVLQQATQLADGIVVGANFVRRRSHPTGVETEALTLRLRPLHEVPEAG